MVGESYQETQAAAVEMSAKDGLMFIPPYDDPFTIAGQGTIGDEIMRQVWTCSNCCMDWSGA
jgi:threonine dehydratase